jgi:hypothetical protein
LGGPQSRFGCCGEEKNLLAVLEAEPRFLGRSATMVAKLRRRILERKNERKNKMK